MTRHIGFGLNIIALGLFFPGIFLPMFMLNMELSALISNTGMSIDIVDKQLSIMATVQELWQNDRLLVSFLIFFFSVCIPVFKTLLISLAYFKQHLELKILNFVTTVGKWSMADVFVVAVFLAVLSTNHADTINHQSASVFGFKLKFVLSTETFSNVGDGFYYFLSYCILSLAATQIYQYAVRSSQPPSAEALRSA